VCLYNIQKNERERGRRKGRERKEPEESKGKFTNKGVKQKEAENKTKQSPDSPPNSAYAFYLSLSLLFVAAAVLSPLSRRRYAHPALKEIETLAPLRLT